MQLNFIHFKGKISQTDLIIMNTNELHRRGMRQTKNGCLQFFDPEIREWIYLSKREVKEIKMELDQFEDQI